jgi:hypothetical protein
MGPYGAKWARMDRLPVCPPAGVNARARHSFGPIRSGNTDGATSELPIRADDGAHGPHRAIDGARGSHRASDGSLTAREDDAAGGGALGATAVAGDLDGPPVADEQVMAHVGERLARPLTQRRSRWTALWGRHHGQAHGAGRRAVGATADPAGRDGHCNEPDGEASGASADRHVGNGCGGGALRASAVQPVGV